MDIKERILKLRELMKENNIDAYIIPSADPHQSEYVADCFKLREWISGFKGSAGTVVVTYDEAGLWTDGRYFIQAERQLQGSGIKLFKMNTENVPTYEEWIKEVVPEGGTVGFDGKVLSVFNIKNLEKETDKKKIKFQYEKDLIGRIWEDRPAMPTDKIFLHDLKFTGKSRLEKIKEFRGEMKKNLANYYLLSSLDDIAWLFNIRGNDVSYLPVVYSYALISDNKACIYINKDKISENILTDLKSDNIEIYDYNEIFDHVRKLENNKTIYYNPNKTSFSLFKSIPSEIFTIEGRDITTMQKAIKNHVEIENIINCQIKDGIAMVKFIKWIKEAVKTQKLEEADIHDILTNYRLKQENCLGASFATIAGYMENAALMHYMPIKGKSKIIKPEGMILIDSGGQYLDGTTDITRTILLGEITDEMKRDFTLVLKSHINLARAIFLYGANGNALDCFARAPLWATGNDYKCGSGHGVGYCLSVHEGPQGFGMRNQDYVFEKGMTVTNEPGIYKEGMYGIRTENTMVVKEHLKNENGTFLNFEIISYCPIELEAIDFSMLNEEEIEYLNDYHKLVFNKLSPHLSGDELKWLKDNTIG